jgi:transaldolase
MTSLLESLRRCSAIVADTGELAAIEKFKPRDATTNPTLIRKAVKDRRYRGIVEAALEATATIHDRAVGPRH